MTQRVSKAEFLRRASAPKARCSALTVTDGTVRLSSPMKGPCVWFERHQEVINDQNAFTVDPHHSTVSMQVDGTPSVILYLVGRRMQSCTFAYNLRPEELQAAAKAMKATGLARFIPAAAKWALEHMPPSRRGPLEAQLKALASARGRSRTRRPAR